MASSTSTTKTTTTSTTQASGKVNANTQAKYNAYQKNGYTQSQAVTNAYNKLQSVQNQLKNTSYTSNYADTITGLTNQILNGDKFSFNANDSVLYQNLKDNYTQQGKTAMQDTMGQAAALTGGYGSSYAQTAGQQTYQNYLQNLNDELMDVYDKEYTQYQNNRSDLYNQLSTAQSLDETDYNRYRDTVSDLQADRSYYSDLYNNERDFDYSKWSDDRTYNSSEYWNQKNSATTTKETSTSKTTTYSASGGSGGSSSGSGNDSSDDDNNNVKASTDGLDKRTVAGYMADLSKRNTKQQRAYITYLTSSGRISASNALYFMDKLGLG